MLNTDLSGAISLAAQGLTDQKFHIIRLSIDARWIELWDLKGVGGGRKVWYPAVSGPLSAYAAGMRALTLFALGDFGQVVAVRSAEPLARSQGASRRRVDPRAVPAVRRVAACWRRCDGGGTAEHDAAIRVFAGARVDAGTAACAARSGGGSAR